MLVIEFLKKALLFLFGPPHNVLYSAAAFVGVNLVLDFFRKYEPPKKFKQIMHEFLKRLLAYMAFLIIANRVDALGVGMMFGWEGSTQLPVSLYIMAREIRVIFTFIREQGIDIPGVLEQRTGQMERNETQGGMTMGSMSVTATAASEINPHDIDRKIEGIKSQLAQIESLRASEDKTKNGGGLA